MYHKKSENDAAYMHTAVETSLIKFTTSLPNPDMRDAAAFAFAILQLVQTTEHRYDACMRLATDTFNYVCAICLLMAKLSEVTPTMAQNIFILKTTVETIMKFAEAQLQHQAMMTRLSLALSGADIEEAQEHREKLDQAIALFGLRANIAETEYRLARGLLEGHSHSNSSV